MTRTDSSPRRRLTGAERRGEILDAAEAAFMADPYERVSLLSIARVAGVSDALVLRYFDTKANLYLAVWDRRLQELFSAQATADAAHGPGATARERLVAGLSTYLDFIAARPNAWAQQFLAPDGEPAGAAQLRRDWRRSYAELIRERGELPGHPLVDTALAGFIGLNEALCLDWVLRDCPHDQREIIISMSLAALSALLVQADQHRLPPTPQVR